MCPKDADGVANSIDPDQAALLEAVWCLGLHCLPRSIKSNQSNKFIGSKSSHRTVTIHIQYTNTNTIIQREYTVYKYIHVKHNYCMCIRHVSVVPMYIMSVKRWVQVCTFICTNTLPKQPLMASHPTYSMYMACNDHNFNCVYLTCDKIKFYGSFWVLYKNIKDLDILIIVKYSITNISACKIDGHHSNPKKYAIYWHGY